MKSKAPLGEDTTARVQTGVKDHELFLEDFGLGVAYVLINSLPPVIGWQRRLTLISRIGQGEPNSVDSRSEPLNEGCDSPSVFKSGTRWATIFCFHAKSHSS